MSTVRTTRVFVSVLGALGPLLSSASCKRSAPAPAEVPSASASAVAPVAERAAPRCRAVTEPGLSATLGERTPPNADGGTDDDVALPFSPEIGAGIAFGGGFALSASLPGKGGTAAAAVLLGPGLPAGKVIDLGKIHGDVSPPRLAALGTSLVAVVPDGAPHGTIARLARIDEPGAAPHVTWGAEILQGSDESEVVALEASARAVVVAWDEWDTRADRSVVKVASLSPADLKKAPSILSIPTDSDAEGPSLSRRAGGFWAAFLAQTPREHTRPPGPAPSGDPEAPPQADPAWIEIVPLDEDGKATGAARPITPREGHVQGFDLASLPNGDALVAYRDDRSVPGTSGGVVRLVTVHTSGTTDVRTLADDDVGPGVPSLLTDPDATRPTWLAFPSDSGVARLAALDAEGRPLDALATEDSIGIATLLSAHGGRVLAMRPHGKGVEAFVLACEKGSLEAKPAPVVP